MDNWHDSYARQVFSKPDATADVLRHVFPREVIEQLELGLLQLVDG